MSELALRPSTLTFLHELSQNNNRAWFQENKGLFNEAKADFEAFVSGLILAFEAELGLEHTEAKACIYRIYKDVRFSKDGTPYKTEFGATIAPEGKKTNQAALHLYVKNDGEVYVDVGTCHMTPDDLRKVRAAIDFDPFGLESFLDSEDFRSVFGGKLIGEQLKSAPRGYAMDHKSIELLRFKNFSIRSTIEFEDLTSEEAENHIRKIMTAAMPFRNYLNRALEFSEK